VVGVVNVMAFEIQRNIKLLEILIDMDAGSSTVHTTLNIDSISMFGQKSRTASREISVSGKR
jgi:hypothetical protein